MALACGCALAAVLAVFPAGAAATPRPRVTAEASFRFDAGNGYRAWVIAFGLADGSGGVVLSIARREEGVVYEAPATVTPTSVQADLGGVGRIDLEFKGSGAKQKAHPACAIGRSVSYEPGVYEGTVEFRGEEGFAQASLTRVPLLFGPLLDMVCGAVGEGEISGPGLPGAKLDAHDGSRLSLVVHKNAPGKPVRFEADIQERRGSVRIRRAVSKWLPSAAFTYDPSLATASLQPPSPFAGTAEFHRAARPANRWTGDLTVDFPGHSAVRLAGARMDAGLWPSHFERHVVRRASA